jgi:DNA processing protein
MSPPSHADAPSRATTKPAAACPECARRSWLLAELSGPLDVCARDRERLQALLALDDLELIEAVGGRRRAQLMTLYESFEPRPPRRDVGAESLVPQSRRTNAGVESVCRHDPAYPTALAGPAAPRMLHVLGGSERLAALCSAPAVAIVGSGMPSDYGREMARSLARGLTVSGASVIAGWRDGIAMAAHMGALETGASVAVMSGGLAVASAARHRALLARLARAGCAVSELPGDCAGRRWGALASERTIVALAAVTVVVEAERSAGDLAPARLARALGTTVAAVPGRVTSPLSAGTNSLLKTGATLVRDPADVLELLYATDASGAIAPTPEQSAQSPPLARRLRTLLERVGAGCDTPERLARAGASGEETLMGLSELELTGLLRRGDGGRYVPSQPLQATFQPSRSNDSS